MADFREPPVTWRKSTASDTSGCVEMATLGGSVLVRDSANPEGVMLRLPPAAWSAFLARTRDKGFRQA